MTEIRQEVASGCAQTLQLCCAVCGSDDGDTLGVTGPMDGSLSSTVVLSCGDCGTVYLSPFSEDSPEDNLFDEIYLRVFDRVVKRAKQSVPPDTKFLVADLVDSSILSRKPEAGLFDQILLPLTLESSENTQALMRHLFALLEDGGSLVVVSGNTGSSCFSFFRGRHWCGYRFPIARQQLGEKSLQTLAASTGFDVSDSKTVSAPDAWLLSLRNVMRDWNSNSFARTILTGPWLVPWAIAWLIESIAVLRGRGAVLFTRMTKNGEHHNE